MSKIKGIAEGAAGFSRGAIANVAAQFPDLYRAATVDGDPSALMELQNILLSGGGAPRGVGGPTLSQPRIGTTAGIPVTGRVDGGLVPAGRRDMIPYDDGIIDAEFSPTGQSSLGDLEGMPVGRGGDDVAGLFDDSPAPRKRGMAGKIAAGAGAGIGGAWVVNEMRPRTRDAGATTADLKAETKPPPSVATAEEPPIKANYREQAYAMMKDLNARRRAAGGEVQDARQTEAEINRLLAMASKEDNAQVRSNSVPAPQGNTDYRRMAQQKLAELNAWQAQHGAGHPKSQQLKAEMSRLYAIADKQANERTTAFPGRR